MSRSCPPRRLALTISLLAGVGVASCRPSAPPPPDVFLVVIDALRPDHLGAYGHPLPTSPTIDAIAREGLVFDRAFSTSTWTKPAIASLFTGLYPSEHGILKPVSARQGKELRAQVLPKELPTLAEQFQAAGYATLGVVRQPHLQRGMGFARGFETYALPSKADAAELVRILLARLDEVEPGRPVFAYLHLLDVHWPYLERLPELPVDAFGAIDPSSTLHRERSAVARGNREGFDPVDLASSRAMYDHGIAWTDRALAALVDGLAKRGRWREAVVVVTADHGEGFGEHGRVQHTYEPFDEVARVPLVVRLPASRELEPGRRESVVSLADVGPTLVELAGLPAWSEATGASFAAIVHGAEDPGRAVLIEYVRARALRARDAKIVLRRPQKLVYFDLVADPQESRNLARPDCEGPCRELLGRMQRFVRALRPSPREDTADVRHSEEEAEDLRALGYL